DGAILFAFAAVFYLTFLALPLVAPRVLAEAWHERRSPWWVSALAGPFFLYALRVGFRGMGGEGIIGLLPIAMAALSVVALAAARQRFGPREPELRLRY